MKKSHSSPHAVKRVLFLLPQFANDDLGDGYAFAIMSLSNEESYMQIQKIKQIGLSIYLILITFFLLGKESLAQESNKSAFPNPKVVENYEESKLHLGAMLGISQPEGSFYRTAPSISIDVGAQPYIPFGVGVEVNYSRNESRDQGSDLERTVVLPRGTYNFGGENYILSKSFVGLGLGGSARSNGTKSWVLAPMAGFDIPMDIAANQALSAGANIKYLSFFDNEPSSLLTSAVIKYWF